MTGRDAFLAAVRHSLRNGVPDNALRPIPAAGNPPISYSVELTDPVARFSEAAIAAGAEMTSSADGPIADAVRRALDLVAPATVAISADPETADVEAIVRDAGVAVADPHDPDALARTDLGITGALAGVALTGSIVVDSRRAGGRLVSLLPGAHLALLPSARIVGRPGDVLRHVARWFPEGLPSNVVFVTGPSRSADIELELTMGVHGPRRVLIALL